MTATGVARPRPGYWFIEHLLIDVARRRRRGAARIIEDASLNDVPAKRA